MKHEATGTRTSSALSRAWLVVVAALAVSLTGCAEWTRNSIWDPTQVGRYTLREATTTSVVRSISINDMEETINAEPPSADDYVVNYSDYVLKPGDVISLSVFELVFEGFEQSYTRQIGDLGFVSVPIIGVFKATGKTTRQLELEISDRLRGDLLVDPQVAVQLLSQRQQFFSSLGQLSPGEHPLDRSDLRLLDVLARLGDVQNQDVKYLYIIRERKPKSRLNQNQLKDYVAYMGKSKRASELPFKTFPTASSPAQPQGLPPSPAAQPTPAPMPKIDINSVLMESSLGAGAASGTPTSKPSTDVPTTEPAATAVATADSTKPTSVYVAGQGWVQVNPSGPTSKPLAPAFDWQQVADRMPQPRIISVPIEDLRRGDPKYNIVVRDGDVIFAPNVKIGEFYIMGNVVRPGAYLFNGRDITLKQAVASAGNLSGLAWPSHCQLVRRIVGDKEEHIVVDLDKIFAGEAPDIYLKPQDLVNVGTAFITTFLAAIRNGFYMNYGFSFAYSQNFYGADGFDLTPADTTRTYRNINNNTGPAGRRLISASAIRSAVANFGPPTQ